MTCHAETSLLDALEPLFTETLAIEGGTIVCVPLALWLRSAEAWDKAHAAHAAELRENQS